MHFDWQNALSERFLQGSVTNSYQHNAALFIEALNLVNTLNAKLRQTKFDKDFSDTLIIDLRLK